jgi:hypothetical protein
MKREICFVKDPFLFNRVSYKDKHLLPEESGIYYVLNLQTNNFLYIGKAQDIRRRWQSHHRYEDIWLIADDFEEGVICIAWELRPVQGLEKAESRRIKALQPLLNNKSLEDSIKIVIQERTRSGKYCPLLKELQCNHSFGSSASTLS